MQTDQQSQFNSWQLRRQMIEPQPRAFPARWQVAAIPSTRIAISHWDNRNLRFVIKLHRVQTHPLSQTLSAWVIPWRPRSMYSSAWRLTHDKDARRFADLQYRTRAKRQVWFASTAFAYRYQQPFKGGIHRFIHNTLQMRRDVR